MPQMFADCCRQFGLDDRQAATLWALACALMVVPPEAKP